MFWRKRIACRHQGTRQSLQAQETFMTPAVQDLIILIMKMEL